MLTASQLKLPKAGSPLILIHQVDEAERDAVHMSSYNQVKLGLLFEFYGAWSTFFHLTHQSDAYASMERRLTT